ncbi:sugar phosphate isomerase/epimerase [Microbacterium sp. p3-SID336]|uniref:sugar phosphate isomerase/epimerase family protein n=1 Tax=Microbacterium sp. p3-SID336 TaxID=2916212 RepID=UPI0021A88F73|nr:sugar phosphate isomerase/epimerase [Microbacterium sp. p3-SID336]MCT1479184.1 sugar phosphate isomerase/epimerase [Microbacterium sp. p3-SID336]
MHLALGDGRLGLGVDPSTLLRLAAENGFTIVEPDSDAFFGASPAEREDFVSGIRERRLDWRLSALPGVIGTTVGDEAFTRLLAEVARRAPLLTGAGVTALSTWLAPANDEAPYAETWQLHRHRLDRLTPLLREHGLRLALEYVGPESWRRGRRHPFVHSLDETRRLIDETRDPECFGLVVDSFHWYTAGETPEDLRAVSADEVLGVDLNDAPRERELHEQQDLERALPGATGVIDGVGFLQALHDIGYAGPVYAEPFDAALAALPEHERVTAARTALEQVFDRAGVPVR